MKKIAVVEKFFESHHQQQIETVAGKHGYTVDYYLNGVLPKERAGEYEIVYGMPDRTALKDMTQLKWFCASFAGVDRYVDEALYPHEGVLLSNSAGAYGVTIAEHIMMVTLMLLRQMMPTMKAVGGAGVATAAAGALHLRSEHHGAGHRRYRHQLCPAGQGYGSQVHLRRPPHHQARRPCL